MQDFGTHFEESYALSKSKDIKENKVELTSPLSIISMLEAATKDIGHLLKKSYEAGSKYVDEELTTDMIVRHSAILGRLIHIRTDKERESNDKEPWDAKNATKRLSYILCKFVDALKLDMFSSDNASSLYNEKTKADDEYRALHAHLKQALPELARLHMSTIGSSHMLPGCKGNPEDELVDMFGQVTLGNSIDIGENSSPKDTIVIFDESGCIPAFELLGLSRLERAIKALVIVGENHSCVHFLDALGIWLFLPLHGIM